jgi:hypothetical protein
MQETEKEKLEANIGYKIDSLLNKEKPKSINVEIKSNGMIKKEQNTATSSKNKDKSIVG